MDRSESERQDDKDAATVAPAVSPSDIRHDPQPTPPLPRPSRLPLMLGGLGVVFGILGLGVAGWSHVEGQRELLRLASEVAELRLSLDLYARGSASESAPAPVDGGALTALSDRLAVLEDAAQTASAPDPVVPAAPTAATGGADDCLPEGTRLLVAAGDSYPICGQAAAVEVTEIQNGFIVLSDGTAVASGGTMALPASACTIGVTSGGDEGLTGYAEIRVTC